tara:strand:- start:65 stop:247 length:183 start_codon:yes stop_codon:yes gene_type:complete
MYYKNNNNEGIVQGGVASGLLNGLLNDNEHFTNKSNCRKTMILILAILILIMLIKNKKFN